MQVIVIRVPLQSPSFGKILRRSITCAPTLSLTLMEEVMQDLDVAGTPEETCFGLPHYYYFQQYQLRNIPAPFLEYLAKPSD